MNILLGDEVMVKDIYKTIQTPNFERFYLDPLTESTRRH